MTDWRPYFLLGIISGLAVGIVSFAIWYNVAKEKPVDEAKYLNQIEALNRRVSIEKARNDTLQAGEDSLLALLHKSDSLLILQRISNKHKVKHEKSIVNTLTATERDSLLSDLLRQYTERHRN